MAESNHLESFAEKIKNIELIKNVWNELADFATPFGINALTYYHMPPPGSQDFSEKYFTSIGFEQELADEYRRNHRHFRCPFTSRSNPLTEPIFWRDVFDTLVLSDEDRERLDTLYCRNGTSNGLVLPVFGPNSRNGCVVFRFLDPNASFNRGKIHTLKLAAYLAHLQFCYLRAKDIGETVNLTRREKEVLTWVARGKSNSVIADIVGISQHTVNGYLRRIYLKTGTSDRTSAAMRAVGDSLIDY